MPTKPRHIPTRRSRISTTTKTGASGVVDATGGVLSVTDTRPYAFQQPASLCLAGAEKSLHEIRAHPPRPPARLRVGPRLCRFGREGGAGRFRAGGRRSVGLPEPGRVGGPRPRRV